MLPCPYVGCLEEELPDDDPFHKRLRGLDGFLPFPEYVHILGEEPVAFNSFEGYSIVKVDQPQQNVVMHLYSDRVPK